VRKKKLGIAAALLFVWGVVLPCQMGHGSMQYAYRQAVAGYKELLADSDKQKDRHNWFVCAEKFRAVYAAEPDGPWSDDAIFMIGRLYEELNRRSSGVNDKHEALDYFSRLIRRYPNSPHTPEAEQAIARLRERKKSTKKVVAERTEPVKRRETVVETEIEPQETDAGSSSSPRDGLAKVEDLRVWSNPDYTRVVIDVEKEVEYSHRLLRKDPAIGKPPRLYVDVTPARIGADLERVVAIGDDLLTNARAAQYMPDVVRVVLDIKAIEDFKIFSLKDPFRVVLDVNGVIEEETMQAGKMDDGGTSGGKLPGNSLAKQFVLGVRRIVIDPGHGGKDPGAVGYYRGVLEKNVTLELSRRVAKKLRQKIGCEVLLTRDEDKFLSLEERTAIANTKRADIFISIHANAHPNKRVSGVETYFLNLATDNESIRVAARENATSAKNISDLEVILNDLMNNAKINESTALADQVQRAMVSHLSGRYSVRDNGVKQAPFYVLLGAEMPCILVETAFISNPKECKRLNTAAYQESVADAIVKGVENYIDSITPTTAWLQTG
jgi:N-acetylmuramoyl-L-alanine amidase